MDGINSFNFKIKLSEEFYACENLEQNLPRPNWKEVLRMVELGSKCFGEAEIEENLPNKKAKAAYTDDSLRYYAHRLEKLRKDLYAFQSPYERWKSHSIFVAAIVSTGQEPEYDFQAAYQKQKELLARLNELYRSFLNYYFSIEDLDIKEKGGTLYKKIFFLYFLEQTDFLTSQKFYKFFVQLTEKEKEDYINFRWNENYLRVNLEGEAFSSGLFNMLDLAKSLSILYELDPSIAKKNKDLFEVSNIQSLTGELKNGEVVMSFYLVQNSLISFYVSNEEIIFHKDETDPEMARKIRGMRNAIKFKANEQYVEIAHELYELLFDRRFIDWDDINKMYVLPDEYLQMLPFECLLTDNVPDRKLDEPTEWPFLIKKTEMAYHYSLAMLEEDLKQKAYSSQKAMLVAPVFSDKPPAKQAKEKLTAYDAEVSRSFTSDGGYIAPLPGSKKEIEAIAAICRKGGYQVDQLMEQGARKKNFLSSDLHTYGILSISTHGIVDYQNHENSGLFFYPEGEYNAYFLDYNEILNKVDLKANLVTLSACETGLGRIVPVDGLYGLPRAFLLSGSENIMASLWKVNDASTSQLMSDFYRYHIGGKMSYSKALRKAKMNLVQDKQFAEPYYWSPFILLGQ